MASQVIDHTYRSGAAGQAHAEKRASAKKAKKKAEVEAAASALPQAAPPSIAGALLTVANLFGRGEFGQMFDAV